MNCSSYIFRAQVTKMFNFLAALFKPITKITLEFILIDFVSTVSNLIWSCWALLLWEAREAEPGAAEQSSVHPGLGTVPALLFMEYSLHFYPWYAIGIDFWETTSLPRSPSWGKNLR